MTDTFHLLGSRPVGISNAFKYLCFGLLHKIYTQNWVKIYTHFLIGSELPNHPSKSDPTPLIAPSSPPLQNTIPTFTASSTWLLTWPLRPTMHLTLLLAGEAVPAAPTAPVHKRPAGSRGRVVVPQQGVLRAPPLRHRLQAGVEGQSCESRGQRSIVSEVNPVNGQSCEGAGMWFCVAGRKRMEVTTLVHM